MESTNTLRQAVHWPQRCTGIGNSEPQSCTPLGPASVLLPSDDPRCYHLRMRTEENKTQRMVPPIGRQIIYMGIQVKRLA